VADDGSRPRHWFLRDPDKMWQGAVTTFLGAAIYGAVFFILSHQLMAALLSAAVLALVFGGASALRLRRRSR